MTEANDFIREFEVELTKKTLKLSQKLQGDVNCVVWDASMVLAKYFEEKCKKNRDFFENLNVLELGSGVGCVGLTTACLGAKSVLLTDLKPNLPLLETNIELNKHLIGPNVNFQELSWGNSNIDFKPHIIVLADCIYYEEAIDPLIQTLKDLSGQHTEIFLSQELRDSERQKECWRYFIRNVSKSFSSTFVPLKEHNPDFRSPEILILNLRKFKYPANGHENI